MAWTVEYKASTERDRVGTVIATWAEPTGEQFVFIEEQLNTNNATQKTNFITKAKAQLATWQTKFTKEKSNIAAIKAELEAGLNT